MSGDFDPYQEWLKISKDRRPPTHYDLLGLAQLVDDAEKIESKFNERYASVRRYQVGEHSAHAVRILQEISKAYDTLSDVASKKAYDEQLIASQPELKSSTAKAKPSTGQQAPAGSPNPQSTAAPAAPSTPTPQPAAKHPTPAPALTPTSQPAAQQDAASRIEQQRLSAPWHYTVQGGAIMGPVDWLEMQRLSLNGQIAFNSEVWQQGWAARRRALEVFPHLAAQQQAAAAPQPSYGGSLNNAGFGNAPQPSRPNYSSPAYGTSKRKGSYQAVDPHGRNLNRNVVLIGLVAILGVVLQMVGMAMGSFTNPIWLTCAMGGAIGTVVLGIALFEPRGLFDSPALESVRSQMGDRPLRNAFLGTGITLVLGAFVMSGGVLGNNALNRARALARQVEQAAENARRQSDSEQRRKAIEEQRATAARLRQEELDRQRAAANAMQQTNTTPTTEPASETAEQRAARLDQEITASLAKLDSDDDSLVREGLTYLETASLGERRKEVVKKLASTMTSSDYFIASNAFDIFENYAGKENLADIVRALQVRSMDSSTKRELVEMLGNFNDSRVVGPLVRLLDEPTLARASSAVLEQHGVNAERAILPELLTASDTHRRELLRVLDKVGTERSLDVLRQMQLNNPNRTDKIFIDITIRNINRRLSGT